MSDLLAAQVVKLISNVPRNNYKLGVSNRSGWGSFLIQLWIDAQSTKHRLAPFATLFLHSITSVDTFSCNANIRPTINHQRWAICVCSHLQTPASATCVASWLAWVHDAWKQCLKRQGAIHCARVRVHNVSCCFMELLLSFFFTWWTIHPHSQYNVTWAQNIHHYRKAQFARGHA